MRVEILRATGLLCRSFRWSLVGTVFVDWLDDEAERVPL